MNCPVCRRELAPTLSICLTCGAMMNDTVREELESKIVRPPSGDLARPESPKFEPIKPWTPQPVLIAQPEVLMTVEVPEPVKSKIVTARLKKETSPTLVDFQAANPALPDWRLKLQNSVRKRNGIARSEPTTAAAAAIRAALSTETTGTNSPTPASEPAIRNKKLENAIKRIEASKKTFGSGAAVGMAAAAQARAKKPAAANRPFPFDIVDRKPDAESGLSRAVVSENIPKPRLISTPRIEKKKFDTNKLPPIPEPELPLSNGNYGDPEKDELVKEATAKISFGRLEIRTTAGTETINGIDAEIQDEIDDLAPFSMRFGAAVFDLIIGAFGAGILLSPLLLSNATVFTTFGLFAIAGATVFIMFIYFTVTIALLGRSFGMKLFSIEMIDAEANELPTFHQAAVHSAVYLISLMLLGIGFLPALFNEERRAMHDLLSGTLLIREY